MYPPRSKEIKEQTWTKAQQTNPFNQPSTPAFNPITWQSALLEGIQSIEERYSKPKTHLEIEKISSENAPASTL